MIQAFKKGSDLYGVGSGAARTLGGYTKAHASLEAAFAEFSNRSAAVLFGSAWRDCLAQSAERGGIVASRAHSCVSLADEG